MESCDKEEKEMKVLLHTVKWDVEGFRYGEFYSIDLEKGQISELAHVLLADTGSNSMVSVGSAIYVVGCQRMESLRCSKKPPNSNCHKKGIYHKGMSYLEDLTAKLKLLKSQDQEDDDDGDGGDCDWKEAPCPEAGMSRSPSVVAFGGKIYVFHIGGKSDSGEVFDPVSNRWDKLLPPPQVGFFDALHTTSAVADPENERILVHFYSCRCIFAYYPEHNPPRWELVMSSVGWSAQQILVDDGIIFTYLPEEPEVVVAFHLPSQQELNVVFTSPPPINVWMYEFDKIISLGDGLFALVAYTSFSDYDYSNLSRTSTDVYFAKFSFHRPPDRPADILITPLLPVQTFTLPTMCHVRNYLLISN